MDLVISKGNSINLNVEHSATNINIGGKKSIELKLEKPNVELKASKEKGTAFEFVQHIIGGANVVRLTYANFSALESKDGKTWYAVTTADDELRQLYLGATLIAKAEVKEGTWAFAYTFPIIF